MTPLSIFPPDRAFVPLTAQFTRAINKELQILWINFHPWQWRFPFHLYI